jgi:arylsulfatase A-like enzyme
VAADHPNILIVFADQLRAGMTGAEGDRQAITPTLDRFATSGTQLTNCIANSPVCCPSRGSMWTGTYPITHRVVTNDLSVRTDLPTLATVCRDAGYRTGYVGKWHLDGVPRSQFTPPGPRRLGFDDFWAAYNCTHSYYDTKYYRDTPELIRDVRYEPTAQTDLGIEFLQRCSQAHRPFLLAVSWGPPHDPYPQVPQKYRDLFDPGTLQPRGNVRPDRDNPLARNLDFARTYADYYAAVTALDDEFGRLLAALDATGQAGDTLVIFTSDHGDMLWSHGWMKKQSPYEESIHVPLFLRGPGVAAGGTVDTVFGLVDLMPSVLSLAGLPVPRSVEGADRLRRADPDASALIMNLHSCDEAEMQAMPEWRGVRTRQYTYVERVPGIPWLLFDNTADPLQLTNLVDHRPDLQEPLATQLRHLLRRTGDDFLSGPELLRQMNLEAAWQDRQRRINW